ncbi:hypothetical protein BC827DRAFT_1159092 [Russula dissimulans]|nr:hypothetical protein BC827DRAFT_1159092 [Russula dissimulans]
MALVNLEGSSRCFYDNGGYVPLCACFKDSKHVKPFVVTQFFIMSFQSIISMCGCILLFFLNIFLVTVIRIHSLTESQLQSGLAIAFSVSAFVLGTVTLILTWGQNLNLSFNAATFTFQASGMAATWKGLQAICECLIMIFLARAFLNARSGLQKSNTVVKHLVCGVIQIGFFATSWAVRGLVIWFFLPKSAIYSTVLNTVTTTAGSITLIARLIYETLLSHIQLRKQMAETGHTEMPLPTQVWHLYRTRGLLVTVLPTYLLTAMSFFYFHAVKKIGICHRDSKLELNDHQLIIKSMRN